MLLRLFRLWRKGLFYAPTLNTFMLISVTKSSTPLISTTDVKLALNIDTSNDDAMLGNLCLAATQMIERETNQDLVSTTSVYALDFWANPIVLPRGPVASVSSVTYYDENNAQQTLNSSYYGTLFPVQGLGRLYLTETFPCPALYPRPDAVKVTFTSGTSCPQIAKQAILLAVGEWYENRENATADPLKPIPLGLDRVLDSLRLYA